MRVEVSVDGPDVPPVAGVPFRRPWHLVGHEVIRLRRAVGDQRRDDVAPDVVTARVVRRVRVQHVDQGLRVEHVDAHRRERLIGGVRDRRGVGRLLHELLDRPPVRAHAQDAERLRVLPRHRQRRHGRARAVLQVLRDHLPRVHPVHVVGADDDNEVRLLVVDQVHRLEDRVSRPAVPVRAAPLLRGHWCHVVAEQVAHPPRHGDVPVQAVALVLREHADLPEVGVRQVGQREVNQPVHPAERHRGFRPVIGQRRQPCPRPACQHDPQDSGVRPHVRFLPL